MAQGLCPDAEITLEITSNRGSAAFGDLQIFPAPVSHDITPRMKIPDLLREHAGKHVRRRLDDVSFLHIAFGVDDTGLGSNAFGKNVPELMQRCCCIVPG